MSHSRRPAGICWEMVPHTIIDALEENLRKDREHVLGKVREIGRAFTACQDMSAVWKQIHITVAACASLRQEAATHPVQRRALIEAYHALPGAKPAKATLQYAICALAVSADLPASDELVEVLAQACDAHRRRGNNIEYFLCGLPLGFRFDDLADGEGEGNGEAVQEPASQPAA